MAAAPRFTTLVDGLPSTIPFVGPERLQDEGVFVRMPGVAPLDRCIRVTVGTAEERTLFARIFEAVLDEVVNGGVNDGGDER